MFITVGPITRLCAGWRGEEVEDMSYRSKRSPTLDADMYLVSCQHVLNYATCMFKSC